jgi:hypothetical protein
MEASMKKSMYAFTVMLAAFALSCGAAGAATFRADISLAPIQGGVGYFLFDLTNGTPTQLNIVTISTADTDGLLGDLAVEGDVSGSLFPGPLTLRSSQFFNEARQISQFGTFLSFEFDTTSNFSTGSIPDSFSFFIIDTNFVPAPTSDPSGVNALFFLDLTGEDAAPVVYTSDFASVSVTQVPEPSLVAGLIIFGLGICHLKRLKGSVAK